MPDDKDKGFVIMGPGLENGGRAALRVDKDGVHEGEMHKSGTAPADCADGEWTRLVTKPIAGALHEVVEEEHIGKPSMVNSKAYRDNYDTIFGKKQVVGES